MCMCVGGVSSTVSDCLSRWVSAGIESSLPSKPTLWIDMSTHMCTDNVYRYVYTIDVYVDVPFDMHIDINVDM